MTELQIYLIAFFGVCSCCFSLVMHTDDFKSALLFKVFPFVMGVCLIAISFGVIQ